MSMQAQPAGRTQAATRDLGEITIVDIKGRITIGEGSVMLREIMVGLLEKGKKQVLLNMTDVAHLDSAGIGELVCSVWFSVASLVQFWALIRHWL
jgi:anti-anti-sigma regulatory factor